MNLKKKDSTMHSPSYTDYLRDYYCHLQNMQRKGKPVLPKGLERGVERALLKGSPDRERSFVRLVLCSS